MVPCLGLQAGHDVPSCCQPAWRHPLFCTCSGQTPRLGAGPGTLSPTPKHQLPLKGTPAQLCHSHLFFQLDSLQLQAGNREGAGSALPSPCWQHSYIPFPLAGRGAPGHPPALAGRRGLRQRAREEEATTTTGQGTAQPVRHTPCVPAWCQVWTSPGLQRDACITGNQPWEGGRDGARPAC